jgi:hypothetical protein
MNDFKELIRKSAVMTLRPGQVVHKTLGLKHTIKQSHKYILYEKIDKPIYKSGYSKFTEIERWKELFGNELKTPKIQTAFEVGKVPLKPLEIMNEKEWKQWIDYAKENSKEYLKLINEKKENEMQWKQYLGLEKLPTHPIPQAPIMYSSQTPAKVKGRILRSLDENTLLVGVQGFVCTLEQIDIPTGFPELIRTMRSGNRTVNREKTYSFHVLSAQHDKYSSLIRNGNPRIRLSLKEPNLWEKKKDMEMLSQSSFLNGFDIKTEKSQSTKPNIALNSLIQSLQNYKK